MAQLILCPSCMETVNETDAYCPHCKSQIKLQNGQQQLAVNTILNGRYVIGKVLGEGGFGITYIAYDLKFKAKVAIKEYYMKDAVGRYNSLTVVPMGESEERSFNFGKQRFLEEAQMLAKFSKEKHIVNVRNYFEENGTAYIVMEYLQGETLNHYLSQHGTMSLDEAVDLLEPVMLALDRVHKSGLIHRDISLSNLMILADGTIKLLDFGAAREQSIMGERRLTVMLKDGYAPFEQYSSDSRQGSWTDVYAMSAVIYRLLTGQIPLGALKRASRDDIKSPSDLGCTIDPKQEAALMQGLALNARDRIQTMSELLQCIRGTRRLPLPRKFRKYALIALASVIAVSALSLGVHKLHESRQTASHRKIAELSATEEKEPEFVKEKKKVVTKRINTDEDDKVTFEAEYEFDKYGNTVRYTNVNISYSGTSTIETLNTYSDDGQSLISKETIKDGVSSKVFYKTEYDSSLGCDVRKSFDEDGNLLNFTVSESGTNTDDDGLEYEVHITKVYSPDGSLISSTQTRERDGFSEYTSYDAYGMVMSVNEQEMDADGFLTVQKSYGPSVIATTTRYTYDWDKMLAYGETEYLDNNDHTRKETVFYTEMEFLVLKK